MTAGCFAASVVSSSAQNRIEKASILKFTVMNLAGTDVTFRIPMADFAKAFDGAPTDPAALAKR